MTHHVQHKHWSNAFVEQSIDYYSCFAHQILINRLLCIYVTKCSFSTCADVDDCKRVCIYFPSNCHIELICHCFFSGSTNNSFLIATTNHIHKLVNFICKLNCWKKATIIYLFTTVVDWQYLSNVATIYAPPWCTYHTCTIRKRHQWYHMIQGHCSICSPPFIYFLFIFWLLYHYTELIETN